ncbi:glutamate transport system substrate-binding protein [Streptomyces sp. 846.5]|nr:glutamate ABC transporter substrate-binding protein [Streptomyces sp. 846.5]TDT97944.1 glutamate transport system substrate-binding protein [Streptomyces sp. 846.5]
MRTTASRRTLTAVALAASSAAVLSACSSGSSSALPPAAGASSTASGSGVSFQQVIDDAPVAAASDIPAGSPMAAIKARGELVEGGTDTSALFSLTDPVSGRTTGFDAGLAAMLAKYITGQPKVKLVQVQVATREALLQNGTVDAVFATYTITPKRATKVAFAGPYYTSGDAILVKKSDSSITKVADLNGRTVCTESSSTAAADIKKYAPSAKLVLFDQNSQCVSAVEQGRADAYVLDQALLLGDAYREPTKVKVVGQPFTAEPYGIGLPLNSPAMKTFVDNWLKKIEADGEWAKLWQATIGTTLGGSAPAPPVVGSVAGS